MDAITAVDLHTAARELAAEQASSNVSTVAVAAAPAAETVS